MVNIFLDTESTEDIPEPKICFHCGNDFIREPRFHPKGYLWIYYYKCTICQIKLGVFVSDMSLRS